jgi:hypothetical protein
MKPKWLAGAALCGIFAICIAVPFVREWSSVDRCLDSGGSFNYETNVCDYQTKHAYIPYSQRHPHALSTFSIAAGAFVIALVASFRR